MKLMQAYFRLLNYSQAMQVKRYFNEQYEYKAATDNKAFANITTGGLSVYGLESQILDAVDFVEKQGFRYELCFEHPTTITKRIVQDLKDKKVII